MKRILGIMLISALYSSSVRGDDRPRLEDLHRMIGHVTRAGYNIYSVFGIEQWEDGKLATHRRQQWTIECDYSVAMNPPSTSCTLTRVVIDEELTPGTGAMISTHRHYTSDGTLRLITADWEGGRLDFTIVNSDKSTTEAMLSMKIKSTLIFLDSFKATAITRGNFFDIPLTTIEYRMPKYTYTLNVPVLMRGLRPMGDKEWDEMFATLSKQDQNAWGEFKSTVAGTCKNLDNISDDELLKKTTSSETRRLELKKGANPTTDEKSKMVNYIHAEFAQCFAQSKISAAGQRKIIELFTKDLKTLTSRK